MDAHLHKFEDDLRRILVSSCLGSFDGLTDLELEYTTVLDSIFARTAGEAGEANGTDIPSRKRAEHYKASAITQN